VIHRDWTPPASAKDAASSGEQLLPFLQGRRLAAELVYVLRPLIHLMVSLQGILSQDFFFSFYRKQIQILFLERLANFDFFPILLRPFRMFLLVVGRLARKST
jgi:hypothetical protein